MGKNGTASVSLLTGLIAVFVLLPGAAMADRGSFRPISMKDVTVAEPGQRAIVAHNGKHEIIILQTDVRADAETRVVEFMPLPSEPKVSLAPEGCFSALQEIVKKHNMSYRTYGLLRGRQENQGSVAAVEVVTTAELGPHSVTVVKVADTDEFIQWVKRFFKKQNLGEPWIDDDMRSVVDDYLDRGFRYFAFDVLTLSAEKKTVQPLIYDFECDHFYYPLKVTNLYGGRGAVELFTILAKDNRIQGRPDVFADIYEVFRANGEAQRKKGEIRSRIMASYRVADLQREELEKLAPRVTELMGDDGAFLLALRYDGRLDFEADVWVEMIPRNPVAWLQGRQPSDEPWLSWMIAGGVPPETLDVLSRDRSPVVRRYVAADHRTPKETLAVLACDDDRDVCMQVIKNPNVTKDILWVLAQRKDVQVSLYAKLWLDSLGVDIRERSQLSGILKKSVKALSPYVLELDGMTGEMWLRGDVLKDISENTRIWVRGVIRSEKYDPKPKDGMTAFPVQWHVYMDVFECNQISSPFEEPRKER